MKKKYVLMAMAGIMVFSTMIGGTLAALDTTTTEGATADVSVKSIGVSLQGKNKATTEEGMIEIETAALPGGNYSSEYSVSNVEQNGYDIYVKVDIYKYWADDEENMLESKNDRIYYESGEERVVYPQEFDECYVTENGWMVQYADEEQLTLYYTKPLKASSNMAENTSMNFMDGIQFDENMGNDYVNKELRLEYVVTAVQANNSEAAMAAEWGMFPVFDESGTLLGVFETESEAQLAKATLAN